ncbi:MAG: hypothetical protein M3Y81_29445 [Chloroflexota bacterium]|nr:hypothetical protein [Chloroflexota bacterium]
MAQLKGVLVLASLRQSTIRDFAKMLHISPSAGSLLADRLLFSSPGGKHHLPH